MSKAYIIIDMPECCDHCDFFDDGYDYFECKITNEMCGYRFDKNKYRMKNCPLRETVADDDKDDLIAELRKKLRNANDMAEKAYQIIGEMLDK